MHEKSSVGKRGAIPGQGKSRGPFWIGERNLNSSKASDLSFDGWVYVPPGDFHGRGGQMFQQKWGAIGAAATLVILPEQLGNL